MESHRKRYTGVLVVTLSLIVATALTALFYYFKIEKNETYQNQLHFRELQRYGTLLTQSVDSLSVGSKLTRSDMQESSKKLVRVIEARNQLMLIQRKIKEITESANHSPKESEKFLQLQNEVTDLQKKIIVLNDNLFSLDNELSKKADAVKQVLKEVNRQLEGLERSKEVVLLSEICQLLNKIPLSPGEAANSDEAESILKKVSAELSYFKEPSQPALSESLHLPEKKVSEDVNSTPGDFLKNDATNSEFIKLANEIRHFSDVTNVTSAFFSWINIKKTRENEVAEVKKMESELNKKIIELTDEYASSLGDTIKATDKEVLRLKDNEYGFKKLVDDLELEISELVGKKQGEDCIASLIESSYFSSVSRLKKSCESILMNSLSDESLQKIKFPNLKLVTDQKQCGSNCDNGFSLHKGKISLFVFDEKQKADSSPFGMIVPLDDFLQTSPLVPLIIITDGNGNRLFRAENLALSARHHGLRFENLSEVVKGAATSATSGNQPVQTQQVQLNTAMINQPAAAETAGTNNKALNLLHSRYFDTELAGEAYRIFVTPWSHPQINNGEVFYLFGVQARNVLMLNKLSVSTSTVLILMLLVVILVAFLPLLKIRLVGYSQTFSRADTHTLMLGFVILLTALSLALFHFVHYSGIKRQLDSAAIHVTNQMQANFSAELNDWLDLAEQITSKPGFLERPDYEDYLFSSNASGGTASKRRYWPEGVAALELRPSDSYFREPYFTGSAYWTSRMQFSKSRWEAPLTGRSYVNDAFSCRLMEGVSYKECNENIYIEQVLNRRDLRLNTWVGLPLFSNNEHVSKKHIAIVGGQLLTFTKPVMPRHFQFLVFDNQSGEVLMHSDERYSKVDNIFVDTDNNNPLKSLVRQAPTSSALLNIVYKGKDSRFAVSRLDQRVPWTLVVIYDKAPLRTLNMLAAFFAFAACVATVCVSYIFVRMIPFLMSLTTMVLWPRQRDISVRWFLLWRLLISVVFVTLFTFTVGLKVASYLTQQYNTLDKRHIESKVYEQKAAFNDLQKTIYSDLPKSDSAGTINCIDYKDEDGSWYSACADSELQSSKDLIKDLTSMLTKTALRRTISDANQSLSGGLINTVWQKLDYDMSSLNELWALAVTSEKQLPVVFYGNTATPPINGEDLRNGILSPPLSSIKAYLTFWTSVVLAIVCSGVLVLLYLLLRYWVCRRLMGLDQPPNFRISPQPPIDKAKNEGYRIYHALARILTGYKTMKKECFYVQLIRPAAAMQALINGKIDKADESLLRTAGLAGLTLHRVQECEAAKTTGECCSDKPILALSGFETLPLEKEKRLKALAFLQQLKQQGDINLILVVEVAPLYRLTHPEAYPVPLKDEDKPTEAEVLAWSELLRDFVKIYDWVPSAREFEPKNKAVDTLLYEASAWPELERVAIEFLVYHFAVKDRELYLETQGDSIGANDDKNEVSTFCSLKQQRNFEYCAALFEALKEGRAPEEVVKSINQKWKNVSQVIDFFGTAAGAHYRYRWELCTTQERLLMINIANEHLPNPRNYIPLDHLVRRGFIFRDKGWHLVNHSFQKFVRTAEDRELVRAWVGEASESIWKYTRFPLLVLLFLLLAGLAYTATEAFQSFFGIFSAVLGAIPLVLRIFSFTRGGSLE